MMGFPTRPVMVLTEAGLDSRRGRPGQIKEARVLAEFQMYVARSLHSRCGTSVAHPLLNSTQHPSETQEIVAHVLGLHSHEVTVQCLRMGGGFGGKEMQPHGYAAIAALGSTLTGRPVRLRQERAPPQGQGPIKVLAGTA